LSIVSNDPIVFVGPGSEWFWSMAQFVVVAVTLLGIYYQFRLQRAANTFEQLNRIAAEWGSEPLLRAKLRVARAAQAGEALPPGATTLIANYWETVASLVRGGHVDARVVFGSVGGGPPLWWAVLADEARNLRAKHNDPGIFANFEWIAEKFATFAASGGASSSYDRTVMVGIIADAIPDLVDRIRMAEESRMAPERVASHPLRPAGPDGEATPST
jgi:hypothetical protein